MDDLRNLVILSDNHLKILLNIYIQKQQDYESVYNNNFDQYEDNIYKIYKEQIKRSIKLNSKIDTHQ